MTFAFDLDGTITRHPKELGEMMLALKNNGHTVCVVTVVGSKDDSKEGRLEWANRLVKGCFNILYYIPFGQNKNEALKVLSANCLVDDLDHILADAKSTFPAMCLLKVF